VRLIDNLGSKIRRNEGKLERRVPWHEKIALTL